MCKKYLYIIFGLLPFGLIGQITVSTEAIPDIGDSIYTIVDNLPQDIEVGSTGGNQLWDFTSLQGPFAQTLVYQSASEGNLSDVFPSANLFLDVGAGAEVYYSNTGNELKELGVVSPDPTGIIGNTVAGFYTNPYVMRRAPLSYGDTYDQDTELLIQFPGEALPDTLLDLLPAVPDSVRVRTMISRSDEVDGWGLLMMPMQSFDVIREYRVEMRNVRIDIFISFLGWVDVTDELEGIIPVSQLSDTTFTYHYFDETSKEAIALVTVDQDDNPQTVIFKRPNMMTPTQQVELKDAYGIFASPNPAYGRVRFSFANLEPGRYNLKLMDILGKTVWETTEIVNGDKTILADLMHLRRGTYLYALTNEDKKRMFTKRLIIVNP